MTIAPTDDGRAWQVRADWHGAIRVVFTGTLYAALAFVKTQTGRSYAAGG